MNLKEVVEKAAGIFPPVNPRQKDDNFIRNGKGASRWHWVSLEDPNRRDKSLKLSHWKKEDINVTQNEKNTGSSKLNLIEYSDEEYEKLLVDKNWTREETDHLFTLCRDFDLRFIVIYDRYRFPNRSIEEIKERYFSVSRIILQNRNMNEKTGIVHENHFDMNREIERKKFAEKYFGRTKEEIEFEEMLIKEAKKIKKNFEGLMETRKNLMRILSKGEELKGPSLSQIITNKDKKSKKSSVPSVVSSATNVVSSSTGTSATPLVSSTKRKADVKEEGVSVPEKPVKKTVGVILRSSTITMFKTQSLQTKVNNVLEELGVPSFPKMPTESICSQFQSLSHSISSLIEVKKQIVRMENEIETLKAKRDSMVIEPEVSAPIPEEVLTPAPVEKRVSASSRKSVRTKKK